MGAQFPMQRGAPHTQENAHLQSVRQCLSVFEGGATGQSIRTFQLAQPEVTHIPISTPSCQGKKKDGNAHTWIHGLAIRATVIARDRANKVL